MEPANNALNKYIKKQNYKVFLGLNLWALKSCEFFVGIKFYAEFCC